MVYDFIAFAPLYTAMVTYDGQIDKLINRGILGAWMYLGKIDSTEFAVLDERVSYHIRMPAICTFTLTIVYYHELI